MAEPDVRYRRTWPQRFVIVFGVVVMVGCLLAAYSVNALDAARESIPRLDIDFDAAIPPGFEAEVEPGDPVNFLLIGVDSTARLDPDDPRNNERDTESLLTDTMLLLRLDPALGQAALLSIPRDLRVDYEGHRQKVNSIRAFDGPEALMTTLAENFNVPINKYVEVDFKGFADVIDAIGGVDIRFDNPARSRRTLLEVPTAGCWQLDGDEALGFVRARSDFEEFIDGRWVITGGDDFDRIERQQAFLVLAAQQATNSIGTNPLSIRRLLEGIQDSQAVTLDNNTSLDELIDLAQAFGDFNPTNLRRFTFESPLISDANDGTFDLVLNDHLDEVQDIFDVFRGLENVLTSNDVNVAVIGGPEDEVEFLDDRFVVTVVESDEDPDRTRLEISVDQVPGAKILVSHLVDVPELVLVDGEGVLDLYLGADYRGLRLVPSDIDEVSDEVDDELEGQDPSETPASATTTTAPDDPDDDGIGAEPAESTTTTEPLLPWQPPVGADCPALGS